MEMFEGIDYNNIDLVSRFFEMKVDAMAGTSITTSVTPVLVEYADLNNFVCKQFSSPGCSGSGPGDLQPQNEEFRQKEKDPVWSILSFKNGNIKMAHSVRSRNFIKLAGRIDYLGAAFFDSSHGMFERNYKKNSQKGRSAMVETQARVDI